MTPQLSIVKTRFAKASLRPRCARHRSWGATCQFPNGCVGHSPTQWLRWTLTYPMLALDTQLPSLRDGSSSKITERAEHLSTALQVAIYPICWAQSLVTRDFQQVLNNGGADPSTERGGRPSIPSLFHWFGNLRGDLSTYAALRIFQTRMQSKTGYASWFMVQP